MKTLAKQLEEAIEKESRKKVFNEMKPLREAIFSFDYRNGRKMFDICGAQIHFDAICDNFLNAIIIILTDREVERTNDRALKNLIELSQPGMSPKRVAEYVKEKFSDIEGNGLRDNIRNILLLEDIGLVRKEKT